MAGEFTSPGSTFCYDSYFGIHSTPVLPQWHVEKISYHSAKNAGGWLQLNMHAPYVYMWLCMKWCDMVYGCMVYTEHAKMATVSGGTSHITTKQCCNYTTWVDISNRTVKLESNSQSVTQQSLSHSYLKSNHKQQQEMYLHGIILPESYL